jgi:hypothetical protein
MAIFSKDKTTANVKAKTEETRTEELLLVERPRICSIDLTQSDFESLKTERYNIFQGSLGATMKIPNYSRHNSEYILLDYTLPLNFHEYDVLILDLNNEQKKEYKHDDHVIGDTKRKSIVQLTCSYPTTIFDPRPLTSSFLARKVNEIHGRKFLQIVFACDSYEVEYEKVEITDAYPQRLANERHNIYNFYDSIPLSDSRTGKEVTVFSVSEDLFSLLTKHSKDLIYEQTFYHPTTWSSEKGNYPNPDFIPLMKNMNNEIVSFVLFSEQLVTFVFPNIKDKASFLSEFLKNVCPRILPELFPFSTQFKWKESQEYFLPNHSALLNEKIENEQDFNRKNSEIENKIAENISKFKFLHDLITETGDALVYAIHIFLKWLEFENVILKDEHSTSILEEDIQVEHENGLLIIETKGIGGTSSDSDCSQIAKIKMRRCKERNAFDVSALYIVNHQRYQPPLMRRNPPFTELQITDALNDERGLLSTWQLFNLYYDIQRGILTKTEARNELLKFGLIEFKPRTMDKLPPTKQILKDGYVVIIDVKNIKLKIGQTLVAEKNNKYFKTKITSIQMKDKPVSEVENGEAGLKLDTKISNGTTLWTE